MISVLPVKLDDSKAEQVRRNHHDALLELQRVAISRDNIVTVTLREGQETKVPHRLGRSPTMVIYSPIRGAVATGRIDDVRREDRSKALTLTAIGWGADITLEVLVI